MHDVLEGALQYEVKLMLQVMTSGERYFRIEELESRIDNIELGYMESKCRPTIITAKTINSESNSLKQNGLFTLLIDI